MQSKQNKTCACHDNGLCLDSRHLSWMLSVIILFSFGFFIAGYFLGKRKAVQDLHATLDQDSLADKIYTSLCTMQEGNLMVVQQDSDSDTVDSDGLLDLDCNPLQSIDADVVLGQLPVEASDVAENELKAETPDETMDLPHKHYFAQLVGFGTQQAAHAFAERLQKKNIPVIVKDRHSKTARGKKVTWYQVVTAPFSNKDELEKIVNDVKIKERLKDVRIITC